MRKNRKSQSKSEAERMAELTDAIIAATDRLLGR